MIKLHPIPDYVKDSVMTIREWLDCVKGNWLIDYDGYGYLGTATEESDISVCPSCAPNGEMDVPNWATHVIWYNR